MPLVTLDDVSNTLSGGLRKECVAKTGLFDDLEQQASIIVRDASGITIPDSAATRPDSLDWVVVPMAWIIEYIGSTNISMGGPEFIERTRNNYHAALDIVRRHRATAQNGTGYAVVGSIEVPYE